MWAIGGASGPVTTYYSDVYSSGNGSSWSVINSNAPFGGRYGSQLLSFNGSLFLIGGNNSGTLRNDVWTSTDGSTWTQILAPTTLGSATQFSPREDFGAVVYNGAMWVIGGFSSGGNNNDVWSSTNGITWNQVLANGVSSITHFSKRWGFSALVYNNAMWLMGGASGISTGAVTAVFNDVWSSTTGAAWNGSTGHLSSTIYYEQTVVHNNQMFLTGGFMGLGWGSQKEFSTSPDGITWTTAAGPFPQRFYHLALEFNNRSWIIGGCDDYCDTTPCPPITYLNDVWYTQ